MTTTSTTRTDLASREVPCHVTSWIETRGPLRGMWKARAERGLHLGGACCLSRDAAEEAAIFDLTRNELRFEGES